MPPQNKRIKVHAQLIKEGGKREDIFIYLSDKVSKRLAKEAKE